MKLMKFLDKLVERKINRHSLRFKVFYRVLAVSVMSLAFYAGHVGNQALFIGCVAALFILWIIINVKANS